MTDDHTELRRVMAALAEHGGNSDLYDRAIRTSRRTGRRRTAASAAALGAAVLAVTVPAALGPFDRGETSRPPATQPAPDPSAPRSTAPSLPATATPPDSTTPVSEQPLPNTTTGSPNACPVTAATLQKAAKLDTGYHIDKSTINCWKTWAVAGVTAPTPAQQGDGLILFQYSPATGNWREISEGSEFDCARDLGLTEDDGHPSWCYFSG